MWFDEGAVETIIEITPTWVAISLLFIGYLGSIYFVAPAVTVAYFRGSSWRTATWPGILLGAYGLFVALKAIFFVERPPIEPPITAETSPLLLRPVFDIAVDFDTGAFPSGHALAATVLWGLIVLDVDIRRLWERLLLGASIVILVSASRVILGLHYIADVVGGVLLGILLLAVMVVVRRMASNPANATLAVGSLPVLAGFPAGEILEASALLAVLVGVFLVNQYTGIIPEERQVGPEATETDTQSPRRRDVEPE